MGLFDFFKRKAEPQNQPRAQIKTSDPISELKKRVAGIGHPEFPFLHQTYSPSSRVPCTDFTGFIVKRLQQNDTKSIKVLMRGILEANPGLGFGPEWIDEEIESVINTPLEKYLSYKEENALLELKAMWIIASKSGGGREYWISDKDKLTLLFSKALCAYHLELKPSINDLIQKANNTIRKWSEDTDYWKDYPKFEAAMLDVPDPGESVCRQKILSLSIGARLHLFQAISYGEDGGSLPNSTDYVTRSFGLNIPETTREILDSRLLIPSEDINDLQSSFSRKSLLELCQEKNVDFKKSWNKQKLLTALEKGVPEFVGTTIKELKIVSINSEYKDDLLSIRSYLSSLENIYKLLCFAS